MQRPSLLQLLQALPLVSPSHSPVSPDVALVHTVAVSVLDTTEPHFFPCFYTGRRAAATNRLPWLAGAGSDSGAVPAERMDADGSSPLAAYQRQHRHRRGLLVCAVEDSRGDIPSS